MSFAVLDESGVNFPGGTVTSFRWEKATGADSLWDGMRGRGLTELFIHASALPGLGLPQTLPPRGHGERAPVDPWLPGQRALAASMRSSDQLELMVPSWSSEPFADLDNGPELLQAISIFNAALGWRWRHSSMSTGWDLLHGLWARHRASHARKVDVQDYAEPATTDGQQYEIPYGGWSGCATLRSRWLHCYDLRSQRLAACGRLPLGLGTPQRTERPDLKRPGYHHVLSVRHRDRPDLPAILEPGWHTSERIRIAQKQGATVRLSESWQWPRQIRYLDPWYEQLRKALASVERDRSPAGRAARGALKLAYLQPLGRLASHTARQARSPWWRPGWYDTVIGCELGRQWLAMSQLVGVIAVQFDTVIVESNEPPQTFTRGLGRWRHEASLEIADPAPLQSLSPAQLVQHIKEHPCR